jgi:hypothetical protein
MPKRSVVSPATAEAMMAPGITPVIPTPKTPAHRGEDDDPAFKYEQSTEFYNQRDFLAGDLFSKLAQTFSAYVAILLALNLVAIGQFLAVKRGAVLMLGVVGFVSLGSILLDLQGACSVKVAIRQYARELEEQYPEVLPPLWARVESRPLYFEERILKRSHNPTGARPRILFRWIENRHSFERETEGGLYVVAARVSILLWIVTVVITGVTLR